eukprot:scaffold4060_cov190-Amphora_coffeaeformis.AAC.17
MMMMMKTSAMILPRSDWRLGFLPEGFLTYTEGKKESPNKRATYVQQQQVPKKTNGVVCLLRRTVLVVWRKIRSFRDTYSSM